MSQRIVEGCVWYGSHEARPRSVIKLHTVTGEVELNLETGRMGELVPVENWIGCGDVPARLVVEERDGRLWVLRRAGEKEAA